MSDIQPPSYGGIDEGDLEVTGDPESEWLGRTARFVLIWLGVVTVACGVGIAIVLRPEDDMTSQRLSLLSLFAGGLGSAIAALASIGDRLVRGWEVGGSGSERRLPNGAARNFLRILPVLAVRPLLGAGVGLLAYAGLVGVLLFASGSGDQQPRTESILFAAVLGGLFAQPLVERLKDTFDHFLGKN
jgi:hypothetical protein